MALIFSATDEEDWTGVERLPTSQEHQCMLSKSVAALGTSRVATHLYINQFSLPGSGKVKMDQIETCGWDRTHSYVEFVIVSQYSTRFDINLSASRTAT